MAYQKNNDGSPAQSYSHFRLLCLSPPLESCLGFDGTRRHRLKVLPHPLYRTSVSRRPFICNVAQRLLVSTLAVEMKRTIVLARTKASLRTEVGSGYMATSPGPAEAMRQAVRVQKELMGKGLLRDNYDKTKYQKGREVVHWSPRWP